MIWGRGKPWGRKGKGTLFTEQSQGEGEGESRKRVQWVGFAQ